MKKGATIKEYLIPTDLPEVQKTSLKVLAHLKTLHVAESCLFDIRLCLEEALINAMKYGNSMRKDLKVHLKVEADNEKVRLIIEDEGVGFKPGDLPDCTQKGNLIKTGGRGVHLIRELMDKVQYSDQGNRLVMTKSFKKTK